MSPNLIGSDYFKMENKNNIKKEKTNSNKIDKWIWKNGEIIGCS